MALKLCYYDPKTEKRRSRNRNIQKKKKKFAGSDNNQEELGSNKTPDDNALKNDKKKMA